MKNNTSVYPSKVKDYSVSNEEFELKHDSKYDYLCTFPAPSPEDLPRYYESENYISHTDGKRSLFEKAYQWVKSISLKRKIQIVRKHSKGSNLLDIGAGTGDFVLTAKQAGFNAVGAEPSVVARKHAEDKGVSLLSSTERIADYSQDAITMWHVLEHVPDVNAQIGELKRLLKPDGILVIAVPNYKSFDAIHYGKYWAAFDVPRHLYHFSKDSIRTLFNESGFSVEAIYPMKFDAYYVSLLSEKYRHGKMRVINAAWTAFRSNLKAMKTGEYSSLIYIITNK